MGLSPQAIKRAEIKRVLGRIFRLVGSVIAICVVIGIPLLYRSYKNRILPGVFIEGIAVGEKTADEARTLIEKNPQYTIPDTLTIAVADHIFSTPSASLQMKRGDADAVASAMAVGRGKNILENLREIKRLLIHDKHIPLTYVVDREQAVRWGQSVAKQVNKVGVAPSVKLRISGNVSSLVVSPGTITQTLSPSAFADTLSAYLSTYSSSKNQQFIAPIETVQPLSADNVGAIRKRASAIIGKSLTFSIDDKKQKLNDQGVILLFALPAGYTDAAVERVVTNWSVNVERQVQEPAITIERDKVTAFTPPRNGRSLDTATAKAKLLEAVKNLENPTVTQSDQQENQSKEIALPFMTIEPKTKLSSLNSLGITERIGFAESFFHHSIPNRVRNVELTARRINLTLIPPGGVFSYNKTVGDVSSANGWLQAYVIQQGRTILGDGGGLCQGSTTLFRAALNAGLPIVERRGHSYRVGYYEQNSPPGIDATVFSPSVDFRFKNDTPANILITMMVDPKDYYMLIEFWGTSDGRKAEINDIKLFNVTPALPTIYQDDPTLPPGVLKQVDFAAGGAKTSFHYRVERDGKTLQDQTFKTTYQPWAAVYLRGI